MVNKPNASISYVKNKHRIGSRLPRVEEAERSLDDIVVSNWPLPSDVSGGSHASVPVRHVQRDPCDMQRPSEEPRGERTSETSRKADLPAFIETDAPRPLPRQAVSPSDLNHELREEDQEPVPSPMRKVVGVTDPLTGKVVPPRRGENQS